MWKKEILLFSFHTLFLVLSKVMPQDLLVFHEENAQSLGQAVPESRKIDTVIAVWLNKCYSFPCFYNKKKNLVRKLYHFKDWHLPSLKLCYIDMERGKSHIPEENKPSMSEPPKCHNAAGGELCGGPCALVTYVMERWCYVSLLKGAGESLFWQRPTQWVGIQQLSLVVESWKVQGCPQSPPWLTCVSWRSVSRSQ